MAPRETQERFTEAAMVRLDVDAGDIRAGLVVEAANSRLAATSATLDNGAAS